ncbi:MAG: hypothetical protein KatS3mg003_0502 [Candidatus Nitrosocaldaceae archaeon]|nr:MAG: hypothetical protein KatS3mg003_0502 [Candidatus Nitrosocaldaceae archaeon]
MLGDIIYEARGYIKYVRVIELDPLTLEGSYIAEGKLRNGINIKEYCTYTSVKKDKDTVYGEGKHAIITDDNNILTWIGRGFGRKIDNKQIWRGSGIFTSNIEEFNDIVGIVEAEILDDRLEIKVWEWR